MQENAQLKQENVTAIIERDQAQAALVHETRNRFQKELEFCNAETKRHESRKVELEAQIRELVVQIRRERNEHVTEIQERDDKDRENASAVVSASISFYIFPTHLFSGSYPQSCRLSAGTSSKYTQIAL